MAQQLNIPKSETELQELLDSLYLEAKTAHDKGRRPQFKGLLEIIFSETVILSAIHKVKGNHGSNTPGSDGLNMRGAILEKGYTEIIEDIQSSAVKYEPKPVRRVWIPKPGKSEKRPLGIPSIKDRVIQECVRMVIEPIMEAQFFRHSYGFRPMREAGMAIERLRTVCSKTNYSWIVEGDISKFFDNVNHTVLLKRLFGMGIRDKRVLMIIKQMLKAGIMEETRVNEIGTPQGGIISPLLANIYLDALDHFVAREWEDKETRHPYKGNPHKYRALKTTNFKPAFFIRYADDWVLVTDTREHAEKWRAKISKFLNETLKLELSEGKTLITNVRKRTVTFLGFDIKVVSNDGKKQCATYVYEILRKYEDQLNYTAYKTLKRRLSGRDKSKEFAWVKASMTRNLHNIHMRYPKDNIPAMKYQDMWIGITCLRFCKWVMVPQKNQLETPYTEKGRQMHQKRTLKKPVGLRADELLSPSHMALIRLNVMNGRHLYNFEYFLNRAYAFNRDRGKCRICGKELLEDVHTHHVKPYLPIHEVNRVPSLACMHTRCHQAVHGTTPLDSFYGKMKANLKHFREALQKP